MKKIRIFFDGHLFDVIYQGTRTLLKGLLLELFKSEYFDIYIGAMDKSNLDKEFGSKCNYKFIKYRHKDTLRRLIIDIPEFENEYAFDYIHMFYICPPFLRRARLIVNICDILFTSFPEEFPKWYNISRKIMFKHAAKKSNVLFTISNYSKNEIKKIFKINGEKIHILPNGFDQTFNYKINDELSAERIKRKYGVRNFILFVSRIEPRKNHDLLLKAYLRLKLYEKGLSLVFVGSRAIDNDIFYNDIKNIPNNIRESIFQFEDVPIDDLIDMYRSTRLFVFPSKGEGYGYPPIEAVSLSAPTICSNNTAMADFKNFDIPLFSPFDLEDLERNLLKYLNSKRGDFYETALSIRQNLTWDKCASEFQRIIIEDYTRNF